MGCQVHLRTTMSRVCIGIAAWVLGQADVAHGQVIKVDEAESCKITCKAGNDTQETIWASGGRVTPGYWGREPGDAVEWRLQLAAPAKDLRLAVRYSYAADHYRRFSHAENPKRTLHLIVDDRKEAPIPVPVPDTGWWDIFQITSVTLPELPAGGHLLKIVSPEPHTTANLDCFILHRGAVEKIPPGLRSSIRSVSTPASSPADPAPPPRFVIRMTPKAVMRISPEIVLKSFDKIYDYYKDFMGWTPPPVGINIIEDARWPDPGATAFQNNYGVFFRASVMHTEQGNWCHEMTHMFYVAHFPGWFDESSVRTLTIFNFVPALFPKHTTPQKDPMYRACEAAGRRFLDNPTETTGDINVVQYAVRVKYGEEVFKQFFHACVEAGRKKELDFTPGRHLNKAEIVKYMSLAAGEDVAPLYERWTGFKDVP